MIVLLAGAIVMTVAAVGFILYPVLWPSPQPLIGSAAQSEELLRRRDRIYAELRELDFDYRVGKVTAEDYREARNQLETEAAQVLQAIDQQVATLEEEIEREVRRLRETRRGCPSCGAAITPRARFCPSCGEPVKAVARR